MCELYKNFNHNTNECLAKQVLVAKLKDSKMDACFDFDMEPDKGTNKGNHIIDIEPTLTIATTKLKNVEPEDP